MGGALPSGGAVSDADAQTSAGGAGGAVAPAVKSKWRGRIGLAVGALLAVSAVVGVMILASVPRPDATLSETDEDVSLDVLQVVNSESRFEIDTSTLRSHEIFEGWDVWSGSNAYGSPCLVAIAPTADWVRVECTPSPGELFADTFPYPLRGGGVMAGPALSSDLERELRALRARAYGPDADIQDDPVALARLDELESARITVHAAPTPPVESSEAVAKTESAQGAVLFTDDDVSARSRVGATRPGTRVMASRAGRIWLIVGSLVVVLALVTATTWFAAPKPKATLQATGVAADPEIFSLAFAAPLAEVDSSTLRGFEPYHGVEPWVAMNAQGARCLMAMERTTDSLAGIRCAPPDAELRLDLPVLPLDPGFNYAAGLAPGTVIRFEVRGDAVDVYLFTPPGTD